MHERTSVGRRRRPLAGLMALPLLACVYAGCSSSPAEPSGQSGTPPGDQGGNPADPSPVALPDLVVSSVDLQTESVSISQPGELSWCHTIANTGAEGPAGNSVFDIAGYASTDATLDASDFEWSLVYLASNYHLSPGFSDQSCWKQTWEQALNGAPPPGTYYRRTWMHVPERASRCWSS